MIVVHFYSPNTSIVRNGPTCLSHTRPACNCSASVHHKLCIYWSCYARDTTLCTPHAVFRATATTNNVWGADHSGWLCREVPYNLGKPVSQHVAAWAKAFTLFQFFHFPIVLGCPMFFFLSSIFWFTVLSVILAVFFGRRTSSCFLFLLVGYMSCKNHFSCQLSLFHILAVLGWIFWIFLVVRADLLLLCTSDACSSFGCDLLMHLSLFCPVCQSSHPQKMSLWQVMEIYCLSEACMRKASGLHWVRGWCEVCIDSTRVMYGSLVICAISVRFKAFSCSSVHALHPHSRTHLQYY